MVSLDQRFTAKTYASPLKTSKRGVPMELLAENEKLRRENEVLQEYFATFEERYREQKKENEQLKRQLNDCKKGKVTKC